MGNLLRSSLLLLLALAPAAAHGQAACNPPGSPLGSIGCQPPLASVFGTDLMLLWRPSIFPNSLGQVTAQQLAQFILSNPTSLPTSCTGLQSGTLWNSAGTVKVC